MRLSLYNILYRTIDVPYICFAGRPIVRNVDMAAIATASASSQVHTGNMPPIRRGRGRATKKNNTGKESEIFSGILYINANGTYM
jgi:hypothetical protein